MLPLVAGVAAVDQRRFHAWDVASGVLWVVVVLIPGYLAAKGVHVLRMGAAPQRWLIVLLFAVSGGAIVVTLAGLLMRWRRRTQ